MPQEFGMYMSHLLLLLLLLCWCRYVIYIYLYMYMYCRSTLDVLGNFLIIPHPFDLLKQQWLDHRTLLHDSCLLRPAKKRQKVAPWMLGLAMELWKFNSLAYKKWTQLLTDNINILIFYSPVKIMSCRNSEVIRGGTSANATETDYN